MNSKQIIKRLKSMGDAERKAGMAGFGISTEKALGIRVPELRTLAGEIGKNHEIALELWASGIHEARLLAGMIDEPKKVTEQQMDAWVAEFDSWDICDQACSNLFDKTPYAYDKIHQWAEREEEYVRRAAFALLAAKAVHDKKASDGVFSAFLPLIEKHCDDERNFVRKAVNWALRQIGKRNLNLNALAVKSAHRISRQLTKSARWIAADALRELESDKVRERLSAR